MSKKKVVKTEVAQSEVVKAADSGLMTRDELLKEFVAFAGQDLEAVKTYLSGLKNDKNIDDFVCLPIHVPTTMELLNKVAVVLHDSQNKVIDIILG